jgi:hypothetical protein
VIADGERLDLGRVQKLESKVVTAHLVREVMSAELSVDQFLRIVNANTVEMQLGTIEFKLPRTALEAMRDVASRLEDK